LRRRRYRAPSRPRPTANAESGSAAFSVYVPVNVPLLYVPLYVPPLNVPEIVPFDAVPE
jgi:hypothetical protein